MTDKIVQSVKSATIGRAACRYLRNRNLIAGYNPLTKTLTVFINDWGREVVEEAIKKALNRATA